MSPLVDIRARLVDQSEQSRCSRCRAPRRAYWRLTSLDTFDGEHLVVERLVRRGRRRAARTRSSSRPRPRTCTSATTIKALGRHLAAGRVRAARRSPSRTSTSAGTRSRPRSSSTPSRRLRRPRLRGRLPSPRFDPEELTAGAGERRPRRRSASAYLGCPTTSATRCAVARSGRHAPAPTRRTSKALALQDYFRDNFNYTLEVQRRAQRRRARGTSCSRPGRGTASSSPAAYAAMARSLGCRPGWRSGFTPGRRATRTSRARTACAASTPTPGPRCTSPARLGAVRADAGPGRARRRGLHGRARAAGQQRRRHDGHDRARQRGRRQQRRADDHRAGRHDDGDVAGHRHRRGRDRCGRGRAEAESAVTYVGAVGQAGVGDAGRRLRLVRRVRGGRAAAGCVATAPPAAAGGRTGRPGAGGVDRERGGDVGAGRCRRAGSETLAEFASRAGPARSTASTYPVLATTAEEAEYSADGVGEDDAERAFELSERHPAVGAVPGARESSGSGPRSTPVRFAATSGPVAAARAVEATADHPTDRVRAGRASDPPGRATRPCSLRKRSRMRLPAPPTASRRPAAAHRGGDLLEAGPAQLAEVALEPERRGEHHEEAARTRRRTKS